MLSNDVLATPRVRPPAQARRSVSMQVKHSPPPPYAALKHRATPLETLPTSPSESLARGSIFNPEESGWMKDRSREDLTDLLTKAEHIIRERENQLSVTSAFCKSLHEDSVTLKTKHKALLAGIPGTSAASTVDFPSISPTPPSPTPSSRNASLSGSIIDSFVGTASLSPTPLLTVRRSRKISVSPSDIALLSDQNAELLQKLERLESESRQADQVGRRALKRLEKEIQGLREELEATQTRSEELEEKTRRGFGMGVENAVEEVLKRKQERVAKIRALRGKGESPGSDEEGEVRDFAPGSAVPRVGGVPRSPSKQSPNTGNPNTQFAEQVVSTHNVSHPVKPYTGNDLAPAFDPPRDSEENNQPPLPQESALVSQLLMKIEELEATNAQIKQQQVETATKLHSVQRDAENINKLYECLGDPANVEWEVVVDDNDNRNKGEQNLVADDTIRFRSLRRTLEGDISNSAANAIDFGNCIGSDNCSTAYGKFPLNINSYKQRKSVVGLFDSGPGALNKLPASGKKDLLHVDVDSIQRSWSSEVNSPALSALSLSATPLHTLGSELGSEFGDDWGANAGNHHLRATSLVDLTDISFGRRSPSPMPTAVSSSHTQDQSDSNTVMQVTLEKPTPERPKFKYDSGEEDQHTPRSYRMSQTIRSRTSRWVDGRFNGTLHGSKTLAPVSDSEKGGTKVFIPLSTNSGTIGDVIAETFTGSEGGDDNSQEVSQAQVKQLRKREQKAIAAFVLEIWLWLQFAMIILVFLWAMAKRGPKTVLEDAERKHRSRLRG